MADVLTREQRRRNMSAIRGKNTAPEMCVRRSLHAMGFRYRLHDPGLPGRPDLVFPRYRAAIFIHGCFWHWHGCRLCKVPDTRPEWWKRKLAANRARDERVIRELRELRWRVLVIWECALRGARAARSEAAGLVARWTADWLRQGGEYGVIEGSVGPGHCQTVSD